MDKEETDNNKRETENLLTPENMKIYIDSENKKEDDWVAELDEELDHGIPNKEWKEYDKALDLLWELLEKKGRCEGCKEAIELLGKKEDDFVYIRVDSDDSIHFSRTEV